MLNENSTLLKLLYGGILGPRSSVVHTRNTVQLACLKIKPSGIDAVSKLNYA